MSVLDRFEPVTGRRDAAGLVIVALGAAVMAIVGPGALLAGVSFPTLGMVAAGSAALCLLGPGLREETEAGQWGYGGLFLVMHGMGLVVAGNQHGSDAVAMTAAALLFGLVGAVVLGSRDPVIVPGGAGGGFGGDGGCDGGGGC